ncbi:MAG TPA: hypothetical protein VHA12_00130 [Candidatus Nanoarchaeia archaeon]|nr:hypothetical protein [Candidatus Nanoarchaeia archaeon]
MDNQFSIEKRKELIKLKVERLISKIEEYSAMNLKEDNKVPLVLSKPNSASP